MPVQIIVLFDLDPDHVPQTEQAFRDLAAETATEPGVNRFEAYRVDGQPHRVVLVEEWAGQSAIDEHMTHEHTNRFRTLTSNAFIGGAQVHRLETL